MIQDANNQSIRMFVIKGGNLTLKGQGSTLYWHKKVKQGDGLLKKVTL